MHTVLVVVQVLVAVGLIGFVLLQHGKGADAGAAFGSGASGTVFGARGAANFLSRTTAWLAAAFFASSLALAYLVNGQVKSRSVTESLKTETPAPAVPAAPAAIPAVPGGTSSAPAEVPAVPSVPAAGTPAAPAEPAPSTP